MSVRIKYIFQRPETKNAAIHAAFTNRCFLYHSLGNRPSVFTSVSISLCCCHHPSKQRRPDEVNDTQVNEWGM